MKYLPLLFLIAACRSVAPTVENHTSDSTIFIVKERIDTLYLAGEVLELPPIYIECDTVTNKPKPFTTGKSGKRLDIKSKLNSKGWLTIKASCDSLATVVTMQDKEIFRLRHEKRTVIIPPQITHEPYWFDILFRWWALLTAAYIVWRNRTKLLSMLTRLPIGR